MKLNRTTQKEYEERLKICASCPGNHVMLNNNGEPYTCGNILESIRNKNVKTCGCILAKKAKDKKEVCPFDYWPKVE